MNKKTPSFRPGNKRYSRDAGSGSPSSQGRGKDGYFKKRDDTAASEGRKYRGDNAESQHSDNRPRQSGTSTGRDTGSQYGQRPTRDNKDRYSDKSPSREGRTPYGERSTRDNKDRYSDKSPSREGRTPYGAGSTRDSKDRYSDNSAGRGGSTPYGQRSSRGNENRFSGKPAGERKPYSRERIGNEESTGYKKFGKDTNKRYDKPAAERRTYTPQWKKRDDKSYSSVGQSDNSQSNTIRLNKYIANSGICSRRDADLLITSGAVSVNGEVVTTLGTKVNKNDTIVYDGNQLTAERKVYILLNKPKDYITTLDDPQGRRTVMSLIKGVGNVRLFPVGRLDRNTTGLLMLTNDGELAKKLTHPKHSIKKLYHVELDKPLAKSDMNEIAGGIEIDGEKVVPDAISYVADGEDKKQIGIEIHSGQNRVVRRIFESLEYKVEKLDRVLFAGLSKRDLPRGHWRYLSDKEVSFLKMI